MTENEKQLTSPDYILPEDRDLLHFRPFAERRRMSDEPIDPNNVAYLEIIQAIEKSGGQIPFSEFMGISLFGKDGYYSKGRAKIGAPDGKIHFSTSPEISEAFGGTIGLQMARVWEAMGKPDNFRIVELGGGTGVLAKSLLESVRETNPDFYQSLSYTILEYGDLIAAQQATIDTLQLPDSERSKVSWVQGSAIDLPFQGIEGAIISNEVPDAFPIERVVKVDDQIRQKYVTVDERGRFFEVLGEPSQEVMDYITAHDIKLEEKVEEPINLSAAKFQQSVDQALKRGVVLTIDYGRNSQVGVNDPEKYHSLRFKGRPFDKQLGEEFFMDDKDSEDDLYPYKYPGQIDITARVNFKVLSEIARKHGLSVVFSGTQEQFLKRAGIYQEVGRMESAEDRSNAEKLILTQDGDYGDYYAQLLTKGIQITLPSPESYGPSPFEPSQNIYKETIEKLGFVEDQRLRELREIIVQLLQRKPEPTPNDKTGVIDYPPVVTYMIKKYRQSADALLKENLELQEKVSDKFNLILELTYARMLYEGNWRRMALITTASARSIADKKGVQFSKIFEETSGQEALQPRNLKIWEATRTKPYPPGPTPFEQSPSVQEEVLKELGFVENERLRMLRVRLTNFLRTVNESEDEYPDDLIFLVKQYQETAEVLMGEPRKTRSEAKDRARIGLELTYSRIFWEGGWVNESRKRVADANLHADNLANKYPGLFGKVTEATQRPINLTDSGGTVPPEL